jgi:hypothetical protein
MEGNWIFLGVIAFCAVIAIIFFIRKNLKDKKEAEKFFNEEIRRKKDKFSDDDEF